MTMMTMTTDECTADIERYAIICINNYRVRTMFALLMAILLLVMLAIELLSLFYSGTSLTTHRLRLKEH